MARKRATIILVSEGPPSPPRRVGSLLNADPSGAVFARNIHRFDGITDNRSDEGIDTVTASQLRWNDPQWRKRHPQEEE